MACRLCATTSTHMAPSDRRCAFGPDGRFRTDSYLCATLQLLLAKGIKFSAGHLHTAIIRGDGDSNVVLSWVGAQSRIAHAAVISAMGEAVAFSVLDLSTAEKLIAGGRPA